MSRATQQQQLAEQARWRSPVPNPSHTLSSNQRTAAFMAVCIRPTLNRRWRGGARAAALLWIAVLLSTDASILDSGKGSALDWCSANCPDAVVPQEQAGDMPPGAKYTAIVGCQKCGTTFLHAWLATHPGIAPALPSIKVRLQVRGHACSPSWSLIKLLDA